MALRSRHCRITAGLESMDRPLLVSSVESQLWGSVRGYTAPVGWLRGVLPCFAYCCTSSILKRSSFGFSASCFALSLRDGATLPGRVCLSPRSERRLFLHLPGVWLESSRWGHPVGSSLSQSSIGTKALPPPSWWLVRVFAMGSPCRVGVCPRSRSERRLFAHLPWWLVSSLRDGVTHFGSGGAFLRPRSERRLLPFIYP